MTDTPTDQTLDITLHDANDYARKLLRSIWEKSGATHSAYEINVEAEFVKLYSQAVQLCNASASVLGNFNPPHCSPGASARSMLRGELSKLSAILKSEELKYSPPTS